MLITGCLFLGGIIIIILVKPLNKHHIIATIGNKIILTYGLFQTAGHIVGLAVFIIFTPKELAFLFLILVSFIFFPVSAITARAVCGITDYWSTFKKQPLTFIMKAERYSAFGGVIGAVGSYLVGVLFFKIPFGTWTIDAFCFAFLAGEFFSRLGCHINGCCYGRLVNLKKKYVLSVTYENPLQKATWHGNMKGKIIYSAPLYMSLTNLVLFCLLFGIAIRADVPSGFIGGLGLLLIPYSRLINEYLRNDRHGIGKVFTYIVLSLLFCVGYIALFQSLSSWNSSSIAFNIKNLFHLPILIILLFDYIVIFILYGISVEFRKEDLENSYSYKKEKSKLLDDASS